jgi:hypothetical protein
VEILFKSDTGSIEDDTRIVSLMRALEENALVPKILKITMSEEKLE